MIQRTSTRKNDACGSHTRRTTPCQDPADSNNNRLQSVGICTPQSGCALCMHECAMQLPCHAAYACCVDDAAARVCRSDMSTDTDTDTPTDPAWEDITALLTDVAARMVPGQMLYGHEFRSVRHACARQMHARRCNHAENDSTQQAHTMSSSSSRHHPACGMRHEIILQYDTHVCLCCFDAHVHACLCSLQDAMSALEVLDIKMDSCMNQQLHMNMTRAPGVVPAQLTLKQQVAIIDALMCAEVRRCTSNGWMDGCMDAWMHGCMDACVCA